MSTPERSEPFAALSEAPPEQPESDRLPAATPDRQSEPPESGGVGRASPRSSIRPAPADYRPRSDRPAPSPMVVVYSGDSDRPPPRWEVDEPSDRPTIAHFAPVPRQPFPLAEDLQGSESGEATRPSVPNAEANGTPTLRLSTWPAPPDDATTARTLRSSRNGRRWPYALLGLFGVLGVALALPRGPASQSEPEATPVAEATTRATPTLLRAPDPAPRAVTPEAPPQTSSTTAEPAERTAETLAPMPAPENGKFQRVTLEVFPTDAKVVRKGLRQPGPPYAFKVPTGSRIAIEVAKKGFVTRRVVLDGSEPTVTVGLRRASSRRRGDPMPAARSGAREDTSSRVGSGL